MIKTVLEGSDILSFPPKAEGIPVAPVVSLEHGLMLDDRVFESPTLIMGSVGSGKSFLLDKIMNPIFQHAKKNKDNVIVFCAKGNP